MNNTVSTNTLLTIRSHLVRHSWLSDDMDFSAALDSRLRAMGVWKPAHKVDTEHGPVTSPAQGWASVEVTIDETTTEPVIRLSFSPRNAAPGMPIQAILACVEDCLDAYADWSFTTVELEIHPIPAFDPGDYPEGVPWAEMAPPAEGRDALLHVAMSHETTPIGDPSDVFYTGAPTWLIPDPENYNTETDGSLSLPVRLPRATLGMAAVLFDYLVKTISSSTQADTVRVSLKLN